MSIWNKITTGTIGKITDIVDKSITDKDKRNEMIYQISLLMMQSKIAPYVRALLGCIVVIGCMFFGDKMTLTPDTQQYCLYSVLGYYFLDRVLGGFTKGK